MWSYSPELHLCIVSSVNMVSVALTALGLIAVRFGSQREEKYEEETPIVTFITIVCGVALSLLTVYIICIVGTYKRMKLMLIPFLILKSILALNFIAIFLYLCIVKEKELVSLKTLYVGISSLGSTVEIYFLMVGLMVYRDIYYRTQPSKNKASQPSNLPMQQSINNPDEMDDQQI